MAVWVEVAAHVFGRVREQIAYFVSTAELGIADEIHDVPRPAGWDFRKGQGFVSVRRSLVGRCAAIRMMQQRIADLPTFVLGCCELHSQKQTQLKVGAFEPQPSVYQN